jgi:hypothetical protein
MNRLLALAVVASLGTGCVVSDTCDVRTVRFTWNSFLRADGSVTSSCAAASLGADPTAAALDVFLDSTYVGSAFCNGGFLDVGGVGVGGHDVTIEARDANDFIILRDQFTFQAPSACGDLLEDSQPAEGYASVSYHFYAGSVPASPDACVSGSNLFFNVTDTLPVPPVPAYQNSSTACTPSKNFLLPLAAGTYSFDWMQEQVLNNLESSACSSSQFSPSKSLSINGGQTTPITVAMQTSSPAACH